MLISSSNHNSQAAYFYYEPQLSGSLFTMHIIMYVASSWEIFTLDPQALLLLQNWGWF